MKLSLKTVLRCSNFYCHGGVVSRVTSQYKLLSLTHFLATKFLPNHEIGCTLGTVQSFQYSFVYAYSITLGGWVCRANPHTMRILHNWFSCVFFAIKVFIEYVESTKHLNTLLLLTQMLKVVHKWNISFS